jgi:hypothetical protein
MSLQTEVKAVLLDLLAHDPDIEQSFSEMLRRNLERAQSSHAFIGGVVSHRESLETVSVDPHLSAHDAAD